VNTGYGGDGSCVYLSGLYLGLSRVQVPGRRQPQRCFGHTNIQQLTQVPFSRSVHIVLLLAGSQRREEHRKIVFQLTGSNETVHEAVKLFLATMAKIDVVGAAELCSGAHKLRHLRPAVSSPNTRNPSTTPARSRKRKQRKRCPHLRGQMRKLGRPKILCRVLQSERQARESEGASGP
jgi:hypothetical protein